MTETLTPTIRVVTSTSNSPFSSRPGRRGQVKVKYVRHALGVPVPSGVQAVLRLAIQGPGQGDADVPRWSVDGRARVLGAEKDHPFHRQCAKLNADKISPQAAPACGKPL